jgi:DNA primase
VRSVGGQLVGFGGRILPESPYASRSPKYYNSPESPLFNKSELLYGLDQAKFAAAQAGYLAVVEGYTDVLMAQQFGVGQVVATMGTALTASHVRHLRRFVPRVVLVFDADAGGVTGVDRALEIFVHQDVELAIATLPAGLDPCDLLVEQGAGPFQLALTNAVDALDFKLNQVLAREAGHGVEGQRRAVDAVLGIMALAPSATTQSARVKQELIVTRIAHRLGLREETVWARLDELRAARRRREAESPEHTARAGVEPTGSAKTKGPAAPEERELLEVLLAEPNLVPAAFGQLPAADIRHPGLRRMLEGLYALHSAGDPADLDGLRVKLEDPRLAQKALELQEVGRGNTDRPAWLQRILTVFRQRHVRSEKERLQGELAAATTDAEKLELLRRLQDRMAGTDFP